MRTWARCYQSIFDSGEVKTRAELARYLDVSRARVTQVLNRLKTEWTGVSGLSISQLNGC